jgi:hypothetical protein
MDIGYLSRMVAPGHQNAARWLHSDRGERYHLPVNLPE